MTASTQTSGEDADEDPFLGRVLDQRYRLLRRLGEGGMGLVYEAKHEILGGRLAVKVLRSEAARDAESIERLKREAQSASAIGSDHIVDVRDFGRMQDGSTYVVMELIEGVDLFKEIRTAPLEWKRARFVALQICDALGKAHEGGIVHRDLKPENVLLTTRRGHSDFVKIVDFGIAKMEGSAKITAAGRVMGTPEYMSPEQCAGINVDHRTDIYSLGVLLFEMVTGQLPFSSGDLATLVRMQIKDPPPSPARVRPQAKLPADFERIVLFCLNKHADDRYESMRDVAEALRAIDESVLAEGSHGEARRLTPREASVTQVYVEGDAEPPPTREALASEETPEKRQSGPRDVEPRGVGPSTTAVIPATRPRSVPLWLWAVAAVGLALGVAFGISMMGEPPEATAAIRASEEVSAAGPATDEVSPEQTPAEPSAREERSPTSPEPIAPDPSARTFVTLESDPSAAGVYRDGALVGETPLEMVRPAEGERLELTLRASGYRDHQVVLGPLTASQLRVVLERAPRTGSRPPEEPAVVADPPTPPAPPPADPRHREFRDPWSR